MCKDVEYCAFFQIHNQEVRKEEKNCYEKFMLKECKLMDFSVFFSS